ncbi:hypothetical protein N7461_001416, partial [Penicillium sp. DV-2018c]
SLDSGVDTLDTTSANIVGSAETGVAEASAAAQTAGSEVNNSVQEIADNLKSSLPGYYSVGLLGYCEGYDNKAAYCSDPSTSFFFNITSLFQEISPGVSSLMPGIESKALGGYQSLARWSISAYILGLIFSFASIVFGVTVVATSLGKIPLVISHLMATVFVTAATISTTVIYGLMAGAIKATLQNFGIFASFGARTFTTAWLGND